jgi:hypothetical protein
MNKHTCLKSEECKACNKTKEVVTTKPRQLGRILNEIAIPDEYINVSHNITGHSKPSQLKLI